MKYRADVDGLRALAVLPVLFFHANIPGFAGGFVGVDVFFVISGFVITARLKDDLDAGRFSILDFYERRIRRIFPALFFMFFLTTIAALLLLLPPNFMDYSKSLVYSAGFISNIYFFLYSGYFQPSALLRPLLHTWSLAVEEQYYIFMPIAMYIVHRYFRAKWLLVFLPATLLSLGLSIAVTSTAPTANFFLLPTRAWELLLGALLVLTPPPLPRSAMVKETIGLVGIAMIGFAVLTYSEATAFPGASALAPCLGAALLIYSGQTGTTFAARLLSIRPLVWVGLISYSLYLMHWPITVFLRYQTLQDPTLVEGLVIILASFALAIISWRYVEQPFRKVKGVAERRRILAGAVASLAGLLAVGLVGLLDNGLSGRFPSFKEPQIAGKEEWREGSCFLMQGQKPAEWNEAGCDLVTGHSETVLLWGDSFAAHYVPGITRNASRIPFNVIQYTAAGCPPVLDYYSYARPGCQEFNRNAIEIIKKRHVTKVILSSRWKSLEIRGLDRLDSTLTALSSQGLQVFVLGQSAEFGAAMDILDYRSGSKPDSSWSSNISPELNISLREIIGNKAQFIDPMSFQCAQSGCVFKESGSFLYEDFGHLSAVGSAKYVDLYFPIVRKSTASAE